jgi:hypothetical protein
MRYTYPTVIVKYALFEEGAAESFEALCRIVRDEGTTEEELTKSFFNWGGYSKEDAKQKAKEVLAEAAKLSDWNEDEEEEE